MPSSNSAMVPPNSRGPALYFMTNFSTPTIAVTVVSAASRSANSDVGCQAVVLAVAHIVPVPLGESTSQRRRGSRVPVWVAARVCVTRAVLGITRGKGRVELTSDVVEHDADLGSELLPEREGRNQERIADREARAADRRNLSDPGAPVARHRRRLRNLTDTPRVGF